MTLTDRKQMLLEAISEQLDEDEDLIEQLEIAIEERDFDFIEELVEAAFIALGWAFDAIGNWISDVYQSMKRWLN